MPSSRLSINDNAEEVSLCPWHLRKIFNEEGIWARTNSARDEFGVDWGEIRERKNPSADAADIAKEPYNQEFVIFDKKSTIHLPVRMRYMPLMVVPFLHFGTYLTSINDLSCPHLSTLDMPPLPNPESAFSCA